MLCFELLPNTGQMVFSKNFSIIYCDFYLQYYNISQVLCRLKTRTSKSIYAYFICDISYNKAVNDANYCLHTDFFLI